MSGRCHADTMSKLIQWRIDDFGSLFRSQLEPVCLNIGNCEWTFVLKKRIGGINISSCRPTALLVIKNSSKLDGDIATNLLIASFSIRVVSLSGGRKTLYYKEVKDKRLYRHEKFDLEFDVSFTGRVIVEVEFLNFKAATANVGKPRSIWRKGFPQKDSNSATLSSIGKMFFESIDTDIVICASNGNIGAHRVVLEGRSPVFRSMFSHDLKEKEMSAINISDMSIEACKAFLNYIYSKIKDKDFIVHRLDLLRAADKYDVSDLKDACEESLLEDIDTKNVLERLQNAFLYRLPRLKVCCFQYLVKFGKIFEIREEFNGFIQYGDRELIGEVINEVLSVWGCF